MPQKSTIAQHLRYLLMSVTLLWALMLNGQEVVAYSLPAEKPVKETNQKVVNAPATEKSVVKQKVSLEATTSYVTINLQQATLPAPFPVFAAPTNDNFSALTAKPTGNGFVAQLFPVTIQPNAP